MIPDRNLVLELMEIRWAAGEVEEWMEEWGSRQAENGLDGDKLYHTPCGIKTHPKLNLITQAKCIVILLDSKNPRIQV